MIAGCMNRAIPAVFRERRSRAYPLKWACLLVVLGIAPHAHAREVSVRGDAQLRAAVNDARPGDVIRIGPGVYKPLWASKLRGKADAPITLAAADVDDPPVFRGGNEAMHLSDVSHLVLSRLVIEKSKHNGLNIDDAGSYDTPSHHVTLSHLVVRDVGSDGNHDAIKLSGVDHFRVEHCTISNWGRRSGSGIDMVGCHHGVIEHCTLRHRPEGHNGIQAKGGTADVLIRRCRFEDAGGRAVQVGGSTGLRYFRPAHADKDAYEAKHITVEGCTFIRGGCAVAFVSCENGVFRYNTVYRPRTWLLRILNEQRHDAFIETRNCIVERNLFVWRSDELRRHVNVGAGTQPGTFTFRDNAYFCLDAPDASRPTLPTRETDAVVGKKPRFIDSEKLELTQKAGSPTRSHGVDALVEETETTN